MYNVQSSVRRIMLKSANGTLNILCTYLKSAEVAVCSALQCESELTIKKVYWRWRREEPCFSMLDKRAWNQSASLWYCATVWQQPHECSWFCKWAKFHWYSWVCFLLKSIDELIDACGFRMWCCASLQHELLFKSIYVTLLTCLCPSGQDCYTFMVQVAFYLFYYRLHVSLKISSAVGLSHSSKVKDRMHSLLMMVAILRAKF